MPENDPNQPNPAAPAVPAPAPAGPIKVADPSKPDGFQSFQSLDELVKAKEEANKTISQLQQAQADLQKQMQQFRTGLQQVVAPQTTTGQPQFDSNRYYELLATDPVGAQRYALQFTPEFQEMRASQAKGRLLNVTQVFLSENSTFQPTDDNVKVLLETAGELGVDERTVTPKQLGAAYHYAVAQGKIKPVTTTQAPSTTTTASDGVNPPPALPTTTTLTTSQADNLSTLLLQARSKTEMDDILRKHGIQPPPT